MALTMETEVRNEMHGGAATDAESGAPAKKAVRLYRGMPREVWVGTYVGSIVFFVLNNIFTVLMMGFVTYPAVCIIPILVDVLFIVPAFFLARAGLQATFDPSTPEPPGSWNVMSLVCMSTMLYMALLWGLQSLYKQAAFTTPRCLDIDGQTREQYDQACSWARHSGYFYLHAVTGPVVLIASAFNFMRFSRGAVFDKRWHVWVGRIHNVLLLIASLGAVLLGSVSATADYIKAAFFVLLVLWVPSMLMGWYHIRQGNIPLHKRWMTRNFALTMCAVTLRMYNVFSLGHTPYYLMVYLSLIHPILLEMYLQYTDTCDRVWWQDLSRTVLGGLTPLQQ